MLHGTNMSKVARWLVCFVIPSTSVYCILEVGLQLSVYEAHQLGPTQEDGQLQFLFFHLPSPYISVHPT